MYIISRYLNIYNIALIVYYYVNRESSNCLVIIVNLTKNLISRNYDKTYSCKKKKIVPRHPLLLLYFSNVDVTFQKEGVCVFKFILTLLFFLMITPTFHPLFEYLDQISPKKGRLYKFFLTSYRVRSNLKAMLNQCNKF